MRRLLAGWEQGIHSNQAESANEEREEEGDVFRHRALLLEYKPLPFDSVRRLESEKNLHSRRNMHVGLSFYAL